LRRSSPFILKTALNVLLMLEKAQDLKPL